MGFSDSTKKNRSSILTISLLIAILILVVLGVTISVLNPNFVFYFQPGVTKDTPAYVPGGFIYDTIYILLTMSTDVLYLIGGGVVFFGGVLVTIRFIQTKLEDPSKPSEVTRQLSGYLTLGLAFFIGAEIVKTAVLRTFNEITILILLIASRGLFSLLLYLERRWHGPAETE